MIVNRTRTTQWNLFFHFVSIALMMVSGILLVPLYLHFIPLELYGAWLATGNVLMWLIAVDPGLSAILQQRVGTAYGQKDFPSIQGAVSAGLLLSACAVLLLVFLGSIVASHIPSWLNLSSGVDHKVLVQAFWIAVLGSSLQLFSYSITAINQGLQSSLGIGIIYVIVHVLDIALILILIFSDFGLMAIAYSALFRGVSMTLGNACYLGWRLVKENISFSFSPKKIPELVNLMSFTFFAQASGTIANNMDAFVIARFLGAEVVPVLVLTRKAIEICRTIVSRPTMAMLPALSHLVGEGDIDRAKLVLIRLVNLMIWVLLLVTSGLIVFNESFVRFWVGSHLFVGAAINVLLCVGLLLGIVILSLSNLCVALGNIKGTSLATLAQSAIFVLLIIPGVRCFGLVGVALVPLIAMLLVGAWYFPRTFSTMLKITFEERTLILRESLYSAISAVTATCIFLLFKVGSLIEFAMFVVLFVFAYATILLWLSVAFRAECKELYGKLSMSL